MLRCGTAFQPGRRDLLTASLKVRQSTWKQNCILTSFHIMNLFPLRRSSGTEMGLSCTTCTPGFAPAIVLFPICFVNNKQNVSSALLVYNTTTTHPKRQQISSSILHCVDGAGTAAMHSKVCQTQQPGRLVNTRYRSLHEGSPHFARCSLGRGTRKRDRKKSTTQHLEVSHSHGGMWHRAEFMSCVKGVSVSWVCAVRSNLLPA